jgi:hypothetical protein
MAKSGAETDALLGIDRAALVFAAVGGTATLATADGDWGALSSFVGTFLCLWSLPFAGLSMAHQILVQY